MEWLSPTDYGLRNQPSRLVTGKSLTADMGCNLWPLHQWGDATSRISMEEPVMFGKASGEPLMASQVMHPTHYGQGKAIPWH
jgi:hypothetical protein